MKSMNVLFFLEWLITKHGVGKEIVDLIVTFISCMLPLAGRFDNK